MPDEEKKIIIDEDWKSQVEAEKEAAKQSAIGEPEASAPGAEPQATSEGPAIDDDPPMPPASLMMLLTSLATEAMMSLGQIPHPVTGEQTVRRNQAKYLIDTIEVLKEKTAGNLQADESQAIEDLLHQLRMAFVSSGKG
ncbi:MAG: DUF1844 domain-containing protein [Planctomycetota bacterium]